MHARTHTHRHTDTHTHTHTCTPVTALINYRSMLKYMKSAFAKKRQNDSCLPVPCNLSLRCPVQEASLLTLDRLAGF